MKNLALLSPVSKVVSISEEKIDKNGKSYKQFKVQGLNKTREVHGGIEMDIITPGRRVSINQHEDSYLTPGNPDPFYKANVGDFIAVGIYSATGLEPYEITNDETGEVREVTSYTFGVIRGRDPEKTMNSNGRQFPGTEVTQREEVKTSVFADDED